MLKLLSVLFIIIGCVNTAFAIHCKVCNNATQTDCADPFSGGNKYDMDCSEVTNATGCFKAKTEALGIVILHRLCHSRDISKIDEDRKENERLFKAENAKLLVYEVCTTDLCNSSTSTETLTAAVMSLIVLVVRMLS